MAFILILTQEEILSQNSIIQSFCYIIPQIFFLLEIFINIFTAYYHKGILVKKKLPIIQHFFKNDFPLDFFFVIPPLFLEQSLLNSTLGHISFLLRVFKLIQLSLKMESYLHLNDKANGIYEMIKLFGSILFLDHLLACSWVFLAQMELEYGSDKTWFNEKNLLSSEWQVKYLYSLYFTTTTMITVGYGDIVPYSLIETSYCLFLMIISSGMFAYSLNKFGVILTEMYKKDYHFQ